MGRICKLTHYRRSGFAAWRKPVISACNASRLEMSGLSVKPKAVKDMISRQRAGQRWLLAESHRQLADFTYG